MQNIAAYCMILYGIVTVTNTYLNPAKHKGNKIFVMSSTFVRDASVTEYRVCRLRSTV